MALCPWAFVSQSSFLRMISMQQVLHKLLRILRFVRNYIVGRIAGLWRLFIALLGRQTRESRRLRGSKPGTSQSPEAGEPSLPGNGAGSYLGSSEYVVVAASTVPTGRRSVSPASLQEGAERQSATVPPSPTAGTSTPIPTNLSVHQPHPLYGRNLTTNSSGNLSDWSAQSRASERLSTIINSRESLFAPVDRPSRLPRGTYRQFGPGPDPQLSGQPSRSPSPTNRPNIIHSDARLANSTTNVLTHPHDGDEGRSPVLPPSSLPSIRIHDPSNQSLPITLMDSEESMSMDPPHPTPFFFPMGQSEAASQHSTIASSATSKFVLPGRDLQMIHSDQIPRYVKDITM
jgi:hypothetical protein